MYLNFGNKLNLKLEIFTRYVFNFYIDSMKFWKIIDFEYFLHEIGNFKLINCKLFYSYVS